MLFCKNLEMLSIALQPYVEGFYGFSLDDWLDDNHYIVTDNNKDFALFEKDYDSVYYGHIFCSDRRGREALIFAKKALSFFFNNSDAKIVHGLTPLEKRHVRLFQRKLGFKSYGTVVTEAGEMEHFILTKEDWRM